MKTLCYDHTQQEHEGRHCTQGAGDQCDTVLSFLKVSPVRAVQERLLQARPGQTDGH